ncbi:putative membrane protein [Aliarcobacter cibarius]|uniref:hypothetical protein n=1 Tax=Aliarcobacter cibarius TaxID=255507 RepID=UPI0012461FD8|nr:hypothetical protein [Aliarcobacter cibarius]QEZ89066.1 putative membrane protein [Aliarcobacter cibarius]
MPQLISLLLGFFSSAGSFAKFFLWIGKKVSITAVILPIQITLIGAIITFRLSLFAAIITLIMFVYNKFTDLMAFVDLKMSQDFLTVPYKILQSLGVIEAISDFYASFTIVFTTLLLAFIAKLAVNSLSQLSDEFYKIGVLLQLGIK